MTEREEVYAIIAEVANHAPLSELHLPLASLLAAYVAPYEAGEPFFVDGMSVTKDTLLRFKVVRESAYFQNELSSMGRKMRRQSTEAGKGTAKNYNVIFEDLLRNHTTDVTN